MALIRSHWLGCPSAMGHTEKQKRRQRKKERVKEKEREMAWSGAVIGGRDWPWKKRGDKREIIIQSAGA